MTLFHPVLMPLVHSCSDLIAVVSVSWFTAALIAVSLSLHSVDVPKMSPTYKGTDWLGSWGNNHWFHWRATPDHWIAWQTFKCRIWNQSSEMCRELQPHFTKEHFLQRRREKNRPWANTTSHGFPTGIHCALLHSLILSQWGLYVESGVAYMIASNTETQMTDSWV